MSSGFVTEAEVEELRRVRQEEWEKVRKPEDPQEAPLAPEKLTDRRCLYDRLQEQKMKKQEEFEEAHKLKNLVKTLDDDEADFLDYVDKVRMDEERQKRLEEANELSEFRNKVAELREKELDVLIKQEIGLIKPEKKPSTSAADDINSPSIGTNKTSQTKLLAGIVKRKSTSTSESSSTTIPEKKTRIDSSVQHTSSGSKTEVDVNSKSSTIPSVPYKGNLVCIGVLPGLASYNDSSSDDSGDDSTTDSEKNTPVVIRDLCGRQIVEQQENHEDKRK